MLKDALAAIAQQFPTLRNISPVYNSGEGGLFAFYERNAGPIFVTRLVTGQFVGTVSLSLGPFEWIQKECGVLPCQKHGIWATALARAFAAQELGIARTDLSLECVNAGPNPFEVASILWREVAQMRRWAVVKFGSTQLPTEVGWHETAPGAA